MIRFNCSKCGKNLKVTQAGAGKKGRCPGCGMLFTVPSGSGTDTPSQNPGKPSPAPDPSGAELAKEPEPVASAAPSVDDGVLDAIELSALSGDQKDVTPDTYDEMLADDLSRVLDVEEELRPDTKVSQTNVFRIVSGAAALVGLIALLFSLPVLSHLGVLFTFHRFAGLPEYSNALRPLGMVGALALFGAGLSALTVIAGGLLGAAMHRSARRVMMTGLVLLLLVQIAHIGVGYVEALQIYIGEDGGAITGAAIAISAACIGLLFYLYNADGVVSAQSADEFSDIVSLVDRIFQTAYECRASDVHIEPTREGAVVRFRIDGVLHTAVTYPKRATERIVSRVKILAGMDIAEKRMPQDGGAEMELGGKTVDMRVSTVPSQLGERAVIRILDQDPSMFSLKSLGMEPKLTEQMHRIVQQPHGMFFCTGPTGSGKTTTLYAALLHINRGERNVMTVEDPVEYYLEGIAQLPISKRKGMSFSDGMRSLLRQDPDVIMVGEVRDRETAKIAVEAAQTGHLVLSTLHTNDAAGAVSRLLDLGVEPYLLASTRTAVLAQRLVRRICPNCREPYEPAPGELAALGLSPGTSLGIIYRGRGCSTCMNTGYRERVGIYELLVVDDAIQKMISRSADAGSIRKSAIKAGMTTLRHDGVRKVMAGITTIQEVRRVTQDIKMG